MQLSVQTCTLDGHLHRVTYTRCINTVDSPDDEHRGARKMYRSRINTYEKIVRQVGYLQRLILTVKTLTFYELYIIAKFLELIYLFRNI